ncbi:hypothetical protein [Bacteroides neonati]|uniref:hypothetical protein n=1 Tax=Bacteroides neonati TaxID=1347393 RepID=UPI0004AD4FEE|nr:hypothetical protein [Bacteroides neonati]
MNTADNNIVNGYDITQVKNLLPLIIERAQKYKEPTKLEELGQQDILLEIIITTIKRVRRYRSTEVIDLANLVRLLYGIQKNDSIQIKYNGKTYLDFPYGETTKLLFDTLNKRLATAYSPKEMIQFYKFLYPELLWSEERITPVDNKDTRTCFFEYSASKNYKRIVGFENDDDIDIRLYIGYLFEENVTPYYAKNSKGEFIQPIGFTLRGVKTILAIETTLQKRKNEHYLGALLYTLGVEFKRNGLYEIKQGWFTSQQYAFLYDIAEILGLIDEEYNPAYNTAEKQTFVRKEMIKYNKFMKK